MNLFNKSFIFSLILLYSFCSIAKPKIAFVMILEDPNYKFTQRIMKAYQFLNKSDSFETSFYSHNGDIESIQKVSQEINKKQYDLVIGGETSRTAIILSKFITNIPILSPTATSPQVIEEAKNLFLLSSSNNTIAKETSKLLSKFISPNSTFVFFHNKSSPYSDQMTKEIISKVKNEYPSIPLKIITYFDGLPITKKLLSPAIKHQNVLFISYSKESELRLVHHTLVSNNTYPIYFGGDAWGSNEMITSSFQKNDKKFHAVKYTYWDEDRCQTQRLKDICQSFLKENKSINEYHAIGFDTFLFIKKGWDDKNKTFNFEQHNDFFTSQKIQLQTNRAPNKDLFFYEFKDGKRQLLKI